MRIMQNFSTTGMDSLQENEFCSRRRLASCPQRFDELGRPRSSELPDRQFHVVQYRFFTEAEVACY